MKFKNRIFLTLIIFMVLLNGCFKKDKENEDPNQHDTQYETDVDGFIDNFNDNHPGYELLDYLIATENNAPIKLVVVAFDKENNSSANLFFLFDNNHRGNISLAEKTHAYYRQEDGLRLEKNVVFFSANLEISYGEYEIYDFQITVNSIDDSQPYGINYTSTETIRQK